MADIDNTTEETKKRKRKITKEELEKLLHLRKTIIRKNGKLFAGICEGAAYEYDNFKPCDKCKFLKKNCFKSCGIAMKWYNKIGAVDAQLQYGNARMVSEAEHLDTASVNPGLAEEVDQHIAHELNSDLIDDVNEDIAMNELDNSYEVSED